MSLPFVKGKDHGEDEPSVNEEQGRGYAKEYAKRLWGFQVFLRISSHKVTRIVRTQPYGMKVEGLRIAAPNAALAEDQQPAGPSTETQTSSTSWMVASGVMPPNDPGPQ